MRPSFSFSLFLQVNLHDPVMQIQHLPEVVEQSNADIYAIVHVVDPDPGRHGEVDQVAVIEGDADALFRVRRSREDPKEFSVGVRARLLDREVSPHGYNLTLKAVDRGVPPRTAYKNLHVRLGDLNDHAPVFDREVYEVEARETAPPGTALARLKVSDADSGRNAAVRLNITAGNEDGRFRVNARSGVLYVAKELDAEERSSYTLTVSALDQANVGARRQSSAKVRVSVADVNDNDPTFGPDAEKTVHFEENQPAGARVARVEAADADSGDNGRISYSLANVNPVPFEIDHLTGVVTATRLLDYETDRREWRLVVRASDWGVPFRRQSELRLRVRLRDANDNRPQFERAGCVGRLPRDTPVGTEVIALSALDFDAGDSVSYRFVSGNADGCFGLDPSRGVVSVLCDLRTLPTRRRELNVTATDGQHFSDVTPLVINFGGGSSGASSSSSSAVAGTSSSSGVFSAIGADESRFECRETGVARRMMEAISESQRNNNQADFEDPAWSAAVAAFGGGRGRMSIFGGNIHRPEFDVGIPRMVAVNETAEKGTLLLKVRLNELGTWYVRTVVM